MNKKIITIGLLLSILFSAGLFLHYKYKTKSVKELYLLQVGAYQNYDNVANASKNIENYFVLKDNDLFKIFIGVTLNDQVYEKLSDIYASDFNSYKKIVKLSDDILEEEINKYDYMIMNVNKKEELDAILKEEMRTLKDRLDSVL